MLPETPDTVLYGVQLRIDFDGVSATAMAAATERAAAMTDDTFANGLANHV